jgi:hypothetical protein
MRSACYLAAGGSVWSSDPGPVLLYLRADDVARLEAQLREAEVPKDHQGWTTPPAAR